jgi:hypothetical protein
LTFDFLWSFAELLEAWAQRSAREVARWRRLGRAEGERHARATFRRAIARAKGSKRLR